MKFPEPMVTARLIVERVLDNFPGHLHHRTLPPPVRRVQFVRILTDTPRYLSDYNHPAGVSVCCSGILICISSIATDVELLMLGDVA